MNSYINSYYVAEFIRNIFDVPKYYVFYGTCDNYEADMLLGTIGDVKILLIDTVEFKPNKIVNSIIRIADCNEYYDLFFSITDFAFLILNDIIITLGGVIL